MSWIDDLQGIKEIRQSGVAVVARSVLNFIGASVVDNPITGATDVTISGGGGGGSGDVVGPASSTNDTIPLFSGTTGKLIKASIWTIANLLNRANHTGTQAQSTIVNLVSDLAGKVSTTRTVSTTSPLAGGGALSSDLTLSMPAATASAPGHATAAQITKLDGIEAGADVTDFENVKAALAIAGSAIDVNGQGTLLTTEECLRLAAFPALP